MKESKLFTKAELDSLNKRLDGSKKDPTGIFASRVKPKLIELIEWFKIKAKIKKLLDGGKTS